MNPEEIFNSFYDRLYNFTLLRMRHVQHAEDVVSDVFVKVIEKFDTYKPEKAAFSTWIFTIALNEIRMFYRAFKPTFSLEDGYDVMSEIDIEDDFLRKDEHIQVLQAVNSLDNKRKNIILLKYFGDLTDRQIADIMKLSEKNVGVILTRTRRALKEVLTSCNECSSPGTRSCISCWQENRRGMQLLHADKMN